MKTHPTFCVAMYNHVRTDSNMRISPCCVMFLKEEFYTLEEYTQSEYIQYLKLQMYRGEQPDECRWCWQSEANNLSSSRLQYNKLALGVEHIPRAISEKIYHSNIITLADIKIGNRCNFSCAMCHPGDSSQILRKYRQNLDNEFVKDYTKIFPQNMDPKTNTYFRNRSLQTLEDALNLDTIQDIKLLGGEPFLEKEFINRLINVPEDKKQKLRLHFVTNASFNLVDVVEQLGPYKLISILPSLEGIGITQDYIRKGSRWSEVEKNILDLLDKQYDNVHVGVNSVIQILNISTIHELSAWGKQHGISIDFSLLEQPNYLSVGIVDQSTRELLLKDNSLINYVKEPVYTPELQEQFKRYIKFYEIDHTMQLEQIQPELYNAITTSR